LRIETYPAKDKGIEQPILTLRTPKNILKKLKKGFTLVEVLIVVAILGIIATIAVPALQDAKEESELQAGRGNAKTLNEGIKRAELDNNIDPVLYGNDVNALTNFLLQEGYLVPK